MVSRYLLYEHQICFYENIERLVHDAPGKFVVYGLPGESGQEEAPLFDSEEEANLTVSEYNAGRIGPTYTIKQIPVVLNDCDKLTYKIKAAELRLEFEKVKVKDFEIELKELKERAQNKPVPAATILDHLLQGH